MRCAEVREQFVARVRRGAEREDVNDLDIIDILAASRERGTSFCVVAQPEPMKTLMPLRTWDNDSSGLTYFITARSFRRASCERFADLARHSTRFGRHRARIVAGRVCPIQATNRSPREQLGGNQ